MRIFEAKGLNLVHDRLYSRGMEKLKLILMSVACLLSFQSLAYEPKEGNVSAMLGSYAFQTAYTNGPDGIISPILVGFGVVAMGDVSDHGNLEISLFQMKKFYYRDDNGDFLAEQTQLFHISMGYRYWFNPYFSSALAFASAYPFGDPTVVSRRVAAGHNFETSARALTSYGLDLSVQSQVWANDVMSVILDARYSLSLTSKAGEHADHYGMLLALRYFVQEKQVQQRPKTSPKE